MSRVITRKEAIQALRRAGCSENVVKHSLAVERVAISIAEKIKTNGHRVDLKLVSAGALLHDIGRARSHKVEHGVEGGKILRGLGLERFAPIAEHHVGAGISAAEAKELGLAERDLIPRTLEEKVVTYADKLVMKGRMVSYERALEWFKSDLGSEHPAVERFKRLHDEIQGLMNKR